jgi:four helix bundle protein
MAMRHENLVAWQRADDVFIGVHKLTRTHFPPEERYELSSQIRRAAYSVAANIVEGFARRSLKDRAHFLNVSESSLAEVGYCLHVARRLGYIDDALYSKFDIRVRQTGAALTGLLQSVVAQQAGKKAGKRPARPAPPA